MKPSAKGSPGFAIRTLVLCLSGLALLASGRAPLASTLFDAPFLAYPTEEGPSSVALGDFDEDGVIDAAVATGISIAVHRGDGAGGFLPPATHGAVSPDAIAAGDVNEDGHLDLAVTSGNAHVVSVLLGDGLG